MSYDLMVFDPKAPPADRAGFEAWYRQQTEWTEDHGYGDPNNTTPELRAWFLGMIKDFPAMNGPYASRDYDNARVSDYCIGRSVIYVAFAWSQGEPAYEATFERARKHRVGFYNVSGAKGEVWVPKGESEYVCIHACA
jgi:hypothetical protein